MFTRHISTWSRKEAAECLGTFVLSLGVGATVLSNSPLTPLIAGMILGLFVYTIGPISGSHINPAVTIALLSIKKMKAAEALRYVLAQIGGGLLALAVMWFLTEGNIEFSTAMNPTVGVAEAIGGFVLVFGISAVVFGKVVDAASGLVIGGSLLLGALVTNGVLNPAVALSLGLVDIMYLIAPIVGTVLAAQCYRWLVK